MARAAHAAFTADQHRLLHALRELGYSDVKLAAEFDVSIPTVRKWLRLPIGFEVARSGRPKKNAPECNELTGQKDTSPEIECLAPSAESTNTGHYQEPKEG